MTEQERMVAAMWARGFEYGERVMLERVRLLITACVDAGDSSAAVLEMVTDMAVHLGAGKTGAQGVV